MILKRTFLAALIFMCTASFAQQQQAPVSVADRMLELRNRAMAAKGTAIAPFTVTDLENNIISSDLLKGNIYVLNFWFVACKPCIMEIPELNALVSKYKDDVKFIALAVDNTDAIKKFLAKTKFDYTQIPNARSIISTDFQVAAFPTHIIVDRQNKISYYTFGYNNQTVSILDKNIEALLKE